MAVQDMAEQYARMLEEAVRQTQPEAIFYWKRMFGGAGYYVDEQIFAAWYGDEDDLALKLNESDSATVKAMGSAAALPDVMSKQYTMLPVSIQKNPEEFAKWVGKSMAHVATLPKKKKKKK